MRARLAALMTAVVVALVAPVASAEAELDATLNVVHGVPGLTVTVCLDGNPAITDFEPGEVVSGVPVTAGDHAVTLVPDGALCSAVVLGAEVTLDAWKNDPP